MASDFFSYRRFEERFRESPAKARDEMGKYIASFKGCSRVLDFGCGRGDFLELLRDAGVGAYGVDSDPDAVRICLEKKLECLEVDGLAHLAAISVGSLDGLFAAHVVEHLSQEDFFRMVKLASSRLRAGGMFLAETLNPQCVFTPGVFHLDPTHRRLVHPSLFEHLLLENGFEMVTILNRQFLPEELLKFENLAPAEGTPTPLESAYIETTRKLDILSKLLLRDFLYTVAARRK